MPTSELTKIEKKVLIRAPRSRVWRALTTPSQFAEWFSAEVQGSFVPGERVNMTSTHPLCTGDPHFYLIVERMEPESLFSWRWHPGAANAAEDGSTLVEFRLAEVENETLLTLTESGFDHILLSRRAKAFEGNEHGWDVQLESLTKYAEKAA